MSVTDTLLVLSLPLIFLLSALLIGYLGRKHTSKCLQDWEDLAAEFGLSKTGENFEGKLPSGNLAILKLENRIVPNSGAARRTADFSTVSIFAEPLADSLVLKKEGLLSGVGKRLGLQDIQIDDPNFDKMFWVQGDEKDIKPYLQNSDVRAVFLKAGKEVHSFEVKRKWLIVEVKGVLSKKDLRKITTDLDDIAQKLKALDVSS
jgi:hypothetical protein